MTFTSLVFGNLALILTNRSWSRPLPQALRRPNPALWWILGGTLAVLGLVLYVPMLRELFRFAVLRVDDLMICLLAGGLSVVWCEWLKKR